MLHIVPGTEKALSKCTELDQTCPIMEGSSVREAVPSWMEMCGGCWCLSLRNTGGPGLGWSYIQSSWFCPCDAVQWERLDSNMTQEVAR